MALKLGKWGFQNIKLFDTKSPKEIITEKIIEERTETILQPIYDHSHDFDQGLGTRQNRVGEADVIVALDGSGDFDSIQEALNYLETAGGTIYIKKGVYKISTAISISKPNVVLLGAGQGTILRGMTAGMTMLDVVSGATDVTIRDLSIDTNGADTLDKGIKIASGAINATIENCTIDGADDYGIGMGGTGKGAILNCKITDCGNSSALTGKGCIFQQGTGGKIIGNILKTSYAGIQIIDAVEVIVSENEISSNDTYGIYGSAADSCLIQNNVIKNNNTGGGTDHGIYLTDSDDVIILGNKISGHNYNLNVSDAACSRVLLHSNRLSGAVTANINDSGTNTSQANNVAT